ncbi:MAG: hypothetical protein SNF33_07535 [Candidatus Algichlamydia australiensis]|nr:hypothetical protein [Chlamydiales bacterium]
MKRLALFFLLFLGCTPCKMVGEDDPVEEFGGCKNCFSIDLSDI